MDNHTYDLIKALGEKAEAQQVYAQYEKDAKTDSKDCQKCAALWKRLRDQETKDIEEMKELLVEHIQKKEIT